MKNKCLCATLGLLLIFLSCYGQNQEVKVDQAIRKLDTEFEAALVKGDPAFLEQILVDDYLEVDSQGRIKDKAQLLSLARARSAAPKSKTVGPEKTIEDFAVRVHGETAVVSGTVKTRHLFMENQTSSPAGSQDPAFLEHERFMKVYSKINGQWRLVAKQTTAIAKY